jgi:hypothetical protein
MHYLRLINNMFAAFECSFARAKNILYRTMLYIMHHITIRFVIMVLTAMNKHYIVYHMEQYMRFLIIMLINVISTAAVIVIFLGNSQHIDDGLRYIIDGCIIGCILYSLF